MDFLKTIIYDNIYNCPKCGRAPVTVDNKELNLTEIYCPNCGPKFRWIANESPLLAVREWNEKVHAYDARLLLTKEQLLENWENGYFK